MIPSQLRRILATALGLAISLSACSLLPQAQSDQVTQFITGLANKAQSDLQTAQAVAQVQITDSLGTHAVDPAGAQCAGALLSVQANVNMVLKAGATPQAGPVTVAEVGSLFLPGGPQANAVRDQIISGCAVKVAQVSGAVAGGAVWFQQLAGLFAIAAPLAAMAF